MRFRFSIAAGFALAVLPAWVPDTARPQPREKTTWNYDGGVLMQTNGSFPDGPCFRISGRVLAPEFFENLKRVDTTDGTVYRRAGQTVKEFPQQLVLAFVVYDHYDATCPPRPDPASGPPRLLTRALMSSLRLSLYWKQGVDLHPIENVHAKFFSVDPALARPVGHLEDPPERFIWSYEFVIPSAGVPLTDSLVLILRTPDGRMAARVAARL